MPCYHNCSRERKVRHKQVKQLAQSHTEDCGRASTQSQAACCQARTCHSYRAAPAYKAADTACSPRAPSSQGPQDTHTHTLTGRPAGAQLMPLESTSSRIACASLDGHCGPFGDHDTSRPQRLWGGGCGLEGTSPFSFL